MTTVGFTGTRRLTESHTDCIGMALNEMHPDTRIVTGGCVGVDAQVAWAAHHLGFSVHTVVPADRSRVDPHWRKHCDTFEEMPPGTDYRARNARIVDLSDRIVAIPDADEHAPESRRSGTWMTVRIARRAGKPVQVELYRRTRAAAETEGRQP